MTLTALTRYEVESLGQLNRVTLRAVELEEPGENDDPPASPDNDPVPDDEPTLEESLA